MDIRTVQVGEITTDLPVVPLPNSDIRIIVFDSLGKMQLIQDIAAQAVKHFTKPEVIICPEAKAIPLTQEMARLWDIDYFVLRKVQKVYMKTAKHITLQSITTEGSQKLWYDAQDIPALQGKKVMIFDDVISSGGTIDAVLNFAQENALTVHSVATIFIEGESARVQELQERYVKFETLGYLPLLMPGD